MKSDNKEYWPIEKLINWDKNPRAIKKKDFDRVKRQIKELGEYKPLIVNSGKNIPLEGEVLGGNMRLRAYKELDFTRVWVSLVDPKTEAEKVKYALSDNDSAGYYVETDLAELMMEFAEDEDFSFSDFSVDFGSFDNLDDFMSDYIGVDDKPLDDDVPIPEAGDKVQSESGKVYQLGKSFLMCGDSTNEDDVKTLLNGVKPDSCLTDPPYNVGYNYTKYDDNLPPEEYMEFCKKWFSLARKYSDFVALTPGTINLHMWAQIEKWKSIAPWIKRNAINSGEVSFVRAWEPIIFYGKPKKRRPNDLFEYIIGNVAPDMLEKGEDVSHTCPKPLYLFIDMVKNFKCEVVLDLFGGSGTSLIACEKLGKTCYMMEMDPSYVDLIRKRYALLIGKMDQWEKVTPAI